MTGLFRRLARQATGQPQPTLHSMARLPYQMPPAWREADESVDTAPGAPVAQGPSRADPQTAAAPALHRGTPPPAADGVPSPGMRQAPRDATLAPTEVSPTPVAPAPIAPSPRPEIVAADTDTGRARPGEAPAPPPGHVSSGRRPTDPTPESARPPVAGDVPVAPRRATPPVRAMAEPLPAPLLPADAPSSAVVVAERRPTRATAAPQNPARVESSAAEPAYIHIHIGRIEVTAVPEAPAPKRPRKAGPAPLSLDDYLAKRQRRSS
ncbi:hypothetical protein [Denitromonas iodatirespirans]|uniref:Uncharacterized protein n=1 Tax=Denitromonas iodatirespirans TaxID=2795389 RepID=A0A944HB15_DENI1|nr:hypothetical protein [Denitromonas iodatirespirans]MBT0959891.1 hypothetical protein [Denitromonas iodatirespirans]